MKVKSMIHLVQNATVGYFFPDILQRCCHSAIPDTDLSTCWCVVAEQFLYFGIWPPAASRADSAESKSVSMVSKRICNPGIRDSHVCAGLDWAFDPKPSMQKFRDEVSPYS